MNGYNRVVLLGNLGDAPEMRMTGGGSAVMNLRLATSESYFDKQADERKKRVEWHRVIVWGKRAEALARILQKGERLMVEGSLRTRKYQAREGGDRYVTEIIASDVVLCGGKRPDSRDEPQQTEVQPGPADDDDIPF